MSYARSQFSVPFILTPHNRMPVMLTHEDEQAWLGPQLTIPSQAVEDPRSQHRRPARRLSGVQDGEQAER
jgi:putative SOS response-associated peptidase YedK